MTNNIMDEEKIVSLLKQVELEKQNIRSNLTRIYIKSLSNKSLRQGELMTERAYVMISEYREASRTMREHPEQYVEDCLFDMNDKRNVRQSCDRYCEMLFRVLEVMNETDREKAEKFIKEINSIYISDMEATDYVESELKKKLLEVSRETEWTAETLIENITVFAESKMKMLDASGDCLYTEDQESDMLASAAMVTYILSKNNAFSDEPMDVTLDQTVWIVCAVHDYVKLLSQVSCGEIHENTFREKLRELARKVMTFLLGFPLGIAWKSITGAVSTVFASLLTVVYGNTLFMWINKYFRDVFDEEKENDYVQTKEQILSIRSLRKVYEFFPWLQKSWSTPETSTEEDTKETIVNERVIEDDNVEDDA